VFVYSSSLLHIVQDDDDGEEMMIMRIEEVKGKV
jgi:hypothetical protein